ncbi:glycerol-3-phosphate responsive antiterminator [Virgibacillus alimentarius]|uniref:Glycerol uptake operon antiterminator regulatory protein n=1 Tax=Virgibacillus alimentarius TaxID=698769 RepID=A0ABS4S5K2_9BACI|nr:MULTISPECIES: glycerol-3-phosphate responsive antiterminator [Virgibacillus]MBP2256280.1 glycerol uptake operon antiterminator [Virgibacillus alimentarius]HLR66226.1 glycerol-3-phosphate responsive antiterminator [Virgibacillus sp.]
MEIPTGIIPAIRRMKHFEKGLETKSDWIIILDTRLSQLRHLVKYCKQANKKILIHFDLIKGLKSDEYGLEFLIHEIKPDGILSTRGNIIELSKKNKLLAIQRIFLLDSLALEQNLKQIKRVQPDFIEVMPGLMTDVLKQIQVKTDIPIIVGGLVTTKKEVELALDAGAVGVSTSHVDLWQI